MKQRQAEFAGKKSAQSNAAISSFIDNRASAAADVQRKAMMDASPRHDGMRTLKQLMESDTAARTTSQKMKFEDPEQEESETSQRVSDEEILQGKFEIPQRAGIAEDKSQQGNFLPSAPTQLAKQEVLHPNNTGLPDNLKSGIENLSGMGMDHVRVHYNSPQPAQLNAHAYAQGSDIHLAPGQERHLPHEAWHVVQQAQGRVKPTIQMQSGVPVNDDAGLEHEADVMGAKAVAQRTDEGADENIAPMNLLAPSAMPVAQRAIGYEVELGTVAVRPRPGVAPPPVLSKGMVLWSGSGWDVSVDDLNGSFDLEMRTEPIDDLAAGGRSKAEGRLRTLAALWQRIDNANGIQPASFYSGNASPDIEILSAGAPHYAQIQASAGLSLDALREIRSGAAMAAVNVPGAAPAVAYINQGGEEHVGIRAQVTARLPNIRAALGLGAAENINNMAAVIGMIVEVPVNSWNTNAPYPKGFAGGLMARTDFATVLRQLPPNQVHAIATNAAAWRQELMHIARQMIITSPHAPAHVNGQTSVFRAGSAPGAANFGGRLRMGDWFRDLATGTDRLTAADYRTRYPGRAEADDLESLGSYGARMDAGSYDVQIGSALEAVAGAALVVAGTIASYAPVEGAAATGAAVAGTGALMTAHGVGNIATPNRNRPIFEFRALGQPDRPDLVDAGLAVWDYVDAAHGRGPGGANQLGLGQRIWNWWGSR
ncbi:DUF4157 domain-containing protein [Herbaspirillum chlorophenolicum]|uniref:DUF4157 domain-containing protein n=1 Tax=Herbaspirillum chlorophenolicum TaxID=211589 RepID=A0ABW8F2N4_9BURK